MKYKPKKAAFLFIVCGNKALLLKRQESDNSDTWGLPGGGVRAHERFIDGALRELEEETGKEDFDGRKLCSLDVKGNKGWKVKVFVYETDRKFKCKLNKEHSEWKWVSINKIKDMNLHPKVREQLNKYLNCLKKHRIKFNEWRYVTDALMELRRVY